MPTFVVFYQNIGQSFTRICTKWKVQTGPWFDLKRSLNR